MPDDDLREQIATEAARLMLRGKEQDFAAARKRAARWLKRRHVRREDMPSNAEIQVQLYALSGVMAAERDPAVLFQMRHFTLQLLDMLADFEPRCTGAVANGVVTPGAEIVLAVCGSLADVQSRLRAAGLDVQRDAPKPGFSERRASTSSDHMDRLPKSSETSEVSLHADRLPKSPKTSEVSHRSADREARHSEMPGFVEATLRLTHMFPVEIRLTAAEPSHGLSANGLRQLLDDSAHEEFAFPDEDHPEAFEVFRVLLEPLARVMLDPQTHPEGDALYHSLQVFELGREERPYDEEFLLACLLHDVGCGINPRHPVLSGLDALGTLATERTRFLIEQRPIATHYLRTGDCPKSLRKSEHFEDVVLLARCDREGRVPGAQVGTLDEALDYIAGLATEWDEPDEIDK